MIGLDLNKYLGTWYEIARIPNEFEPKMKFVTADYSLNKDGSIQVVNSGHTQNEFKEIVGRAITTDDDMLLKVSFFSNIYSDYKILYLDEDYQYSLVGGSAKNYLWILSRKPQLDRPTINKLIGIAKENGYDVDKLAMTEQFEEVRYHE